MNESTEIVEDIVINKKVHTSCKNCSFALYNDNDPPAQTDCFAGKIDKFREINPDNIVECYDNDKEFFVINNRLCPFYRNESILDHFDDRAHLLNRIRQRNRIAYHLIIMVLPTHTYDDVEKTLESITQQDIKPTHLTVINRNPDVIPSPDILNKIKELKEEDSGFVREWRVQTAINLDLSDRDYIDISIDGTMNSKINYTIYTVFNAGFTIPFWFSQRLNYLIYEDLFSFFFITPNEHGNGMIVPKAIHKMNNGNAYGRYLENVIGEDECAKKKIYKITELMSDFPQ